MIEELQQIADKIREEGQQVEHTSYGYRHIYRVKHEKHLYRIEYFGGVIERIIKEW